MQVTRSSSHYSHSYRKQGLQSPQFSGSELDDNRALAEHILKHHRIVRDKAQSPRTQVLQALAKRELKGPGGIGDGTNGYDFESLKILLGKTDEAESIVSVSQLSHVIKDSAFNTRQSKIVNSNLKEAYRETARRRIQEAEESGKPFSRNSRNLSPIGRYIREQLANGANVADIKEQIPESVKLPPEIDNIAQGLENEKSLKQNTGSALLDTEAANYLSAYKDLLSEESNISQKSADQKKNCALKQSARLCQMTKNLKLELHLDILISINRHPLKPNMC